MSDNNKIISSSHVLCLMLGHSLLHIVIDPIQMNCEMERHNLRGMSTAGNTDLFLKNTPQLAAGMVRKPS